MEGQEWGDRRKTDSEREGGGERDTQGGEAVGLTYIAWAWGGGLEQSIMLLIYL